MGTKVIEKLLFTSVVDMPVKTAEELENLLTVAHLVLSYAGDTVNALTGTLALQEPCDVIVNLGTVYFQIFSGADASALGVLGMSDEALGAAVKEFGTRRVMGNSSERVVVIFRQGDDYEVLVPIASDAPTLSNSPTGVRRMTSF